MTSNKCVMTVILGNHVADKIIIKACYGLQVFFFQLASINIVVQSNIIASTICIIVLEVTRIERFLELETEQSLLCGCF